MPPDARIVGLASYLPGGTVGNDALAPALEESPDSIARRTGIERRYFAPEGEGPSDLALRAAHHALEQAGIGPTDLGLVIFATATPDVTFPGAACFLQDKLGAGTVGALDVRAQSAGFLCGLDLAAAFSELPGPRGGEDARYGHVLVAAGEVLSSGLDESPRGADLTPRFGDGAAVAIVGRAARGPRIAAVRWRTDGRLAERFWCEYPASRQFPLRINPQNLSAGRHFPRADLAGLAPIVRERLAEAAAEVLSLSGWPADSLAAAIVDYVEPSVARAAAESAGLPKPKTTVPTEEFAHVMAGGLAISLTEVAGKLGTGARVLLAAAGPGFSWGAAAIEL
jgi:3-oxoacyl-[acyl-carrier-protein] synthase-3